MSSKDLILDALLAKAEAEVKCCRANIEAMLDYPKSIPDHTEMVEDVFALFVKLEAAQSMQHCVEAYVESDMEVTEEEMLDLSELKEYLEKNVEGCCGGGTCETVNEADLEEDGFI